MASHVDVWVLGAEDAERWGDGPAGSGAPGGLGAASAWALLDADERLRAAGMAPARVAGFVASRALLRAAVAQQLGCRADEVELAARCPCGGRHGPIDVRAPGDVHVSLTRSSGVVAVAACEAGPVGVDVERAAAVTPALARVVAAPGELRRYQRYPPWRRRALARMWARKEAVLKATRTGLRRDPARVVLAPRAGGYRAGAAGEVVAVGVDLRLARGWVGAVALAAGMAHRGTPARGEPMAGAATAELTVASHDGRMLLGMAS